MSRHLNQRVEDYWAAQLLETGFLAEFFNVEQLERIGRELHGDPPDALYRGRDALGQRQHVWVEFSGAWRSGREAKETFDIAEGRMRAPTGRHGLLVEPDKATAISVANAVHSKLQKDSYKDLVRRYGPGHLLVFVSSDHFPLFDPETLAEIRRHVAIAPLEGQSVFRSVSVGWHGQIYLVWDRSGRSTVPGRPILSAPRERQVWLREGKLSNDIPGQFRGVSLRAVGLSAARETVLTEMEWPRFRGQLR